MSTRIEKLTDLNLIRIEGFSAKEKTQAHYFSSRIAFVLS